MSFHVSDSGATDDLSIEGTIYPPSQPDSAARTVGHLCAEYTTEELQDHVHLLKDLELWLDHNEDTVIGKVVDAQIKPDKGVWIKAVVNASTAAGKETIKQIKCGELPGLSLSHEWKLFPAPGSTLEGLIHASKDWRDLPHDKRREMCQKTFRELSVCKEPARENCYIDRFDHVPSSQLYGVVSASKDSANPPRIMTRVGEFLDFMECLGANIIGTVQHAPGPAGEFGYISHRPHALRDIGVGVSPDRPPLLSGILCCSLPQAKQATQNAPSMESAPPVTQQTQQTQQPAPSAGNAGNAGNPVFAAVAQQQAQVAQQQQQQAPDPALQAAQAVAQQALNRDAQGRFVARNDGTALASAQPEATLQQQAPTPVAEVASPQQPAQVTSPDQQVAQQTQQVPPQVSDQQTQPQVPPVQPAQPSEDSMAPVNPAPASDAVPEMTDAQQQEQIANAMQKAQETILAQKQAQEARDKQHADQLAQMQKQMEEQKQQMEAIAKIKAENEAQLEKVRQEQMAAASANKQRMLAQLNATLNTIGSTQPGQAVVLPQPPQGDAANDATKQSEYEAKLMETTINSMQQLQQQSNTANMEAQNNKRTATDALAAGYNFHTGNPTSQLPMSQVGVVNCSKEPEPATKRSRTEPTGDKNTVLGERIREWYAAQKHTGGRIDYNTCAAQFNSMNAQMGSHGLTGTVNASKGGLWNSQSLIAGNEPTARLCMQHMQPELFGAISEMNPGRIISPEETRALMNTIQPPQSMPMR